MTIGELNRAAESARRIQLRQSKEQASFDYILADLIGISVSRLYSKSARYPGIEEVYPTLFDSVELQQEQQEQKDKLSAIRFRQFADSFNKLRREESNLNE